MHPFRHGPRHGPLPVLGLALALSLAAPLGAEPRRGDGFSAVDERLRVGELVGLPVHDARGERAGTVRDVVVDLGSGRVVGLLVSTGGATAAGRELALVPQDQIRHEGAGEELRLTVTREALDAAPRRWRGEEEKPAEANTAKGARAEPDPGVLDPMDQGNKRADVETTARIRSVIVARDGLSTSAKNVKIITREGRVTLRGAVASEKEKRLVAELAAQAAPGRRIDNRLAVAER